MICVFLMLIFTYQFLLNISRGLFTAVVRILDDKARYSWRWRCGEYSGLDLNATQLCLKLHSSGFNITFSYL